MNPLEDLDDEFLEEDHEVTLIALTISPLLLSRIIECLQTSGMHRMSIADGQSAITSYTC